MNVRISKVIFRAIIIWLALMAAESVSGTLRELLLKPLVDDLISRRISFFIALTIISSITTLWICWIGASGFRELLAVGLLWAALTFGFEAFVLRPLLDISRDRFSDDFDPRKGGLMSVGLVFLTLVPFLASKIRKSIRSG